MSFSYRNGLWVPDHGRGFMGTGGGGRRGIVVARGGAHVTIAAAEKLGFVVQPQNSIEDQTITPPYPQVAIQDAQGNTVPGRTDNVTIAIGTNPGSSTLGGTLTVAAVNGVAQFTDLTLNNVGSGYTLVATAGGLTQAESGEFDVTTAIAGTAMADFGAHLLTGDDLTSAVEGDYPFFFQAMPSCSNPLGYVEIVAHAQFTRALLVHAFNGDGCQPSRDFGGYTVPTKIWVQHFFGLSSNFVSGISHKMFHGYYSGGGTTTRWRTDWEHGKLVNGFSDTSSPKIWTAGASNVRLVPTLMAQPAGTLDFDNVDFAALIRATSPDLWQFILCAERLANPVDGMTRFWLRRWTVSGVVSPGQWYFNGAKHTGTTQNYPIPNNFRMGVNRNAVPTDDMYHIRSRTHVINGATLADPIPGLDAMRPAGL